MAGVREITADLEPRFNPGTSATKAGVLTVYREAVDVDEKTGGRKWSWCILM
jgi:hypothetical protein